MIETKHFLPWPGNDDRLVVESMIHNRHSKYWEDCSKLVKQYVYARAKNIPQNRWEEITQEVMYKVAKNLPNFRFDCALTTWLNGIIKHCIIDMHRRLRNEERFNTPLGELLNESDNEGREINARKAKSAEDAFIINNNLHNAVAALLEYTNIHSHPSRNRLIIWMVIIEGRTHTEAAKVVGCSAPVVGYVVREAQRYARETCAWT